MFFKSGGFSTPAPFPNQKGDSHRYDSLISRFRQRMKVVHLNSNALYCTRKCRTRSTLLAHAKKMHSEEQYLELKDDKAKEDKACTICFKPVHFTNGHKNPNGSAIVKQDIAADYNCVLCRQSFFMLNKLQEHMNYKHECELCRVCNKLVENEDYHVETDHKLRVDQENDVHRDLFFCQVCGVYFEDSRSLKLHSLFKEHYQKLNVGKNPIHHNIGQNFYPHIPVVHFPDSSITISKMKGISAIDGEHDFIGGSNFQFSKNSTVNETKSNENHRVLEIMDTHTLIPLASAAPSPQGEDDRKPRIECEFCSDVFLKFHSLELHTRKQHFTELERMSKDSGICRCCFLKFDSLTHYNDHRNDSGYACEYCDEYHKKTKYKSTKTDCASVESASYSRFLIT